MATLKTLNKEQTKKVSSTNCITPKKPNLSPLSIFIRKHTCVLFKAGGKISGAAVAETLGDVCKSSVSTKKIFLKFFINLLLKKVFYYTQDYTPIQKKLQVYRKKNINKIIGKRETGNGFKNIFKF